MRSNSSSATPARARCTSSPSTMAKIPNSWCKATNSSKGPLAIVVAKSGRSPPLNASATAALSFRYHSIFFFLSL